MQRHKLSRRETEGRLHELVNDQCLQARRTLRRRENRLAARLASQAAREAMSTPPLPLDIGDQAEQTTPEQPMSLQVGDEQEQEQQEEEEEDLDLHLEDR